MHLTRLASIHRIGPESSLLVNALSGAVDVVDNSVRASLLQLSLGQRPALPGDHRDSLIQRGYLFSGEGGERAALHQVYDACQERMASRPLQFVVCPTFMCNLACTYCFESSQLRARPEVMSSAHVGSLFAALQEIAAVRPSRPCQIVLFGGEPLLPITENVVCEILDRAGEAGIPVQVVTNGTHVERFAPLLRRFRGVVQGAQITLDGPQPIHDARRKSADGRGSFSEVVRGVEVCLEAGVEVNLRVNLDTHNIGMLAEFARFLQSRGWTAHKGFRCQFAPVTDHLGTSQYPFIMKEDELVEPLLEFWRRYPEAKKTFDFQLFRVLHHLMSVIEPECSSRSLPRFHYCEADRGDVFTFGPEGLIYVCTESAGTRSHAVGVYHPRYRLWPRRLKVWEDRSVLTLPECQQCNIATFCGGGCGYAALQRFGSPAHGVCGGAPQVFRAYLRTLRTRFQDGEFPAYAQSTTL